MVTDAHLQAGHCAIQEARQLGADVVMDQFGIVLLVDPDRRVTGQLQGKLNVRFSEGVRAHAMAEAMARGDRFCWFCGTGLQFAPGKPPAINQPLACKDCRSGKLTARRMVRIMCNATGGPAWALN